MMNLLVNYKMLVAMTFIYLIFIMDIEQLVIELQQEIERLKKLPTNKKEIEEQEEIEKQAYWNS